MSDLVERLRFAFDSGVPLRLSQDGGSAERDPLCNEAANRIVVLEGALGHAERENERLQSLLETANAYGTGENAARIADRELLAQMMILQSLATGHGDTVGDLVREVEPQIERLHADNFSLAAWQCMFTDGSGLTGDESGRQICLKAQEVERLRAEVEAARADRDRLRAVSDVLFDARIPLVEEVDRLREEVAASKAAQDDAYYCGRKDGDAERDRLQDELEQWKTWGVIEVAIRNPSVSEYMRHWEGRATKAEAERDALLEILREVAAQDVEYEAPHYLIVKIDKGLMAQVKAAIDAARKP